MATHLAKVALIAFKLDGVADPDTITVRSGDKNNFHPMNGGSDRQQLIIIYGKKPNYSALNSEIRGMESNGESDEIENTIIFYYTHESALATLFKKFGYQLTKRSASSKPQYTTKIKARRAIASRASCSLKPEQVKITGTYAIEPCGETNMNNRFDMWWKGSETQSLLFFSATFDHQSFESDLTAYLESCCSNLAKGVIDGFLRAINGITNAYEVQGMKCIKLKADAKKEITELIVRDYGDVPEVFAPDTEFRSEQIRMSLAGKAKTLMQSAFEYDDVTDVLMAENPMLILSDAEQPSERSWACLAAFSHNQESIRAINDAVVYKGSHLLFDYLPANIPADKRFLLIFCPVFSEGSIMKAQRVYEGQEFFVDANNFWQLKRGLSDEFYSSVVRLRFPQFLGDQDGLVGAQQALKRISDNS